MLGPRLEPRVEGSPRFSCHVLQSDIARGSEWENYLAQCGNDNQGSRHGDFLMLYMQRDVERLPCNGGKEEGGCANEPCGAND